MRMPFLNPDIAIKSFGILPGMRVADFGAGAGHWAMAFARAVGPNGKMFAIDIQQTALEAIRSHARDAHMRNIETVHANLETPRATALADSSVDAVMISNILFQAEEKAVVIGEAARIVKPQGSVFLIEWDTADTIMGPPGKQRVSRQDAERLCKDAGLHFKKEFAAGSHHYGLIFNK